VRLLKNRARPWATTRRSLWSTPPSGSSPPDGTGGRRR
jgi:hypothetical protein